jgi:hypothetical protein
VRCWPGATSLLRSMPPRARCVPRCRGHCRRRARRSRASLRLVPLLWLPLRHVARDRSGACAKGTRLGSGKVVPLATRTQRMIAGQRWKRWPFVAVIYELAVRRPRIRITRRAGRIRPDRSSYRPAEQGGHCSRGGRGRIRVRQEGQQQVAYQYPRRPRRYYSTQAG